MVLTYKSAAPQREGRCYKPLHQGELWCSLRFMRRCGHIKKRERPHFCKSPTLGSSGSPLRAGNYFFSPYTDYFNNIFNRNQLYSVTFCKDFFYCFDGVSVHGVSLLASQNFEQFFQLFHNCVLAIFTHIPNARTTSVRKLIRKSNPVVFLVLLSSNIAECISFVS